MALIPGILPSGTCYGTPQDLLELFAQYLNIPAFTLSSRVLYSSGVSPLPSTDYLWVDSISGVKLKVYHAVPGAYLEYPFAGQATGGSTFSETLINGKEVITTLTGTDNFLVSQASSGFSVLKKISFANTVGQIPSSTITYPMLSTSGTETLNAAKRTARAWVYFSATGTVTTSFNVTGITAAYGGTAGRFLITFTANVTNPVVNYTAASATPGSTNYCHQFIESVASNSVVVFNLADGDGRVAPTINCVSVFGET